MKKVFISGSRSFKQLPHSFKEDIICLADSKKCKFLVGDCDGVDSLVQKLLYDIHYKDVTVYASGSVPRNFYGSIYWEKKLLYYPKIYDLRKYYEQKDIAMSIDCNTAIVLWDGKSRATKNNIDRIKSMGKEVFIFLQGGNIINELS